jgi:hypothetical protein
MHDHFRGVNLGNCIPGKNFTHRIDRKKRGKTQEKGERCRIGREADAINASFRQRLRWFEERCLPKTMTNYTKDYRPTCQGQVIPVCDLTTADRVPQNPNYQ